MKDVSKRAEKAKNIVSAHFSQNLAWVNKAGVSRQFNEDQTFTTDTLTELTSKKVGLWMIGTLKHFIRLSRLQGRTGFKMSKPIDLELKINQKTENVSFKFTLSLSRIENMLEKYPALVCEAFTPAPSIGNITRDQVTQYFMNAENLVIAPAIKQRKTIDLKTTADVVIEEVVTATLPLVAQ